MSAEQSSQINKAPKASECDRRESRPRYIQGAMASDSDGPSRTKNPGQASGVVKQVRGTGEGGGRIQDRG